MTADLTIAIVNKPLDAVKQKRQQVKQAKYPVLMFLSMPEVVLQIIPVVFSGYFQTIPQNVSRSLSPDSTGAPAASRRPRHVSVRPQR
jgi:hypothetical protein